MDQKQRQLHHPADALRLLTQAVKPFQTVIGPEFRRTLHGAREYVQTSAEAAQQMGAGGGAVPRHPQLLLGGPQTDEHAVRAAFPDGFHHRGVLLEVAIMSSGDLQSGVLLLQPFRRQVRHAGLGTQQIEGSPALGHLFHQPRSKFDARGLFLQGRSQHSRSLYHADAVRQHQIRAVDRLHGRRVFPADFYDLRVRGHYIVAPRFLQQRRSVGHGFRHGQIIKTNA